MVFPGALPNALLVLITIRSLALPGIVLLPVPILPLLISLLLPALILSILLLLSLPLLRVLVLHLPNAQFLLATSILILLLSCLVLLPVLILLLLLMNPVMALRLLSMLPIMPVLLLRLLLLLVLILPLVLTVRLRMGGKCDPENQRQYTRTDDYCLLHASDLCSLLLTAAWIAQVWCVFPSSRDRVGGGEE